MKMDFILITSGVLMKLERKKKENIIIRGVLKFCFLVTGEYDGLTT